MTDLEAEVQRTSRVAAYLAQDAAVLSKELQSLQMSLRGHARLDLDQRDDVSGISTLELSAAQTPATPSSGTATAAAPAPPAPAGPSKEKTETGGAQAPKSTGNDEGCDGPGETPCSPVNKILTFDYRFPIGWGLLNWVLIVLLAFLFAWCCCACCLRGPRANTR
ncbi:unnamed protein product [Durusdinium trenchii]